MVGARWDLEGCAEAWPVEGTVCLSTHPSTRLPTDPHVHPSIRSPTHPPAIYPFTHSPTHRPIHPSTHLPTDSSIHSPTHPLTYPLTHASIDSSVQIRTEHPQPLDHEPKLWGYVDTAPATFTLSHENPAQ